MRKTFFLLIAGLALGGCNSDNGGNGGVGTPDLLGGGASDLSAVGNDLSGGGNDLSGGGNDLSGGGNDLSGGGNDLSGGSSDLAQATDGPVNTNPPTPVVKHVGANREPATGRGSMGRFQTESPPGSPTSRPGSLFPIF